MPITQVSATSVSSNRLIQISVLAYLVGLASRYGENSETRSDVGESVYGVWYVKLVLWFLDLEVGMYICVGFVLVTVLGVVMDFRCWSQLGCVAGFLRGDHEASVHWVVEGVAW